MIVLVSGLLQNDPDPSVGWRLSWLITCLPKPYHDIMISRYHRMEALMAQLVVRNLDDDVKAKLQRRAKRHGHSTEEEIRDILRDAVKRDDAPKAGLGSRMAARFAGLGLTERIPEVRGYPARPARFKR